MKVLVQRVAETLYFLKAEDSTYPKLEALSQLRQDFRIVDYNLHDSTYLKHLRIVESYGSLRSRRRPHHAKTHAKTGAVWAEPGVTGVASIGATQVARVAIANEGPTAQHPEEPVAGPRGSVCLDQDMARTSRGTTPRRCRPGVSLPSGVFPPSRPCLTVFSPLGSQPPKLARSQLERPRPRGTCALPFLA